MVLHLSGSKDIWLDAGNLRLSMAMRSQSRRKRNSGSSGGV